MSTQHLPDSTVATRAEMQASRRVYMAIAALCQYSCCAQVAGELVINLDSTTWHQQRHLVLM